MSRLKDKFNETIKPALVKEFDIKNPMLIPALEKIVISVGAGDSAKDQKVLQNMADTISLIAGQKAVITDAKKSVAGFKVREGFPVGIKVTLRKEQMYAFLDKLISVALFSKLKTSVVFQKMALTDVETITSVLVSS